MPAAFRELEMTQLIIRSLLWIGAMGCGLLAGVYFAFSIFIMTALGRIGQAHGVLVMNSINSTILQSWFMPLFYGTTISSLVLAISGFSRRGEPGATAMLAGGLVYIAGMFMCTILFNVPLNNALAAVDPASAGPSPVWTRYLKYWTLWNHVRTISSARPPRYTSRLLRRNESRKWRTQQSYGSAGATVQAGDRGAAAPPGGAHHAGRQPAGAAAQAVHRDAGAPAGRLVLNDKSHQRGHLPFTARFNPAGRPSFSDEEAAVE